MVSFFEEWEDGKKVFALQSLLGFSLALVLIWIIVNEPNEFKNALIYMIFLISTIISILDQSVEKNPFVAYSGFGKNFKVAGKAILFGAIVGFIMMMTQLTVASPTVFTAIPTATWSFLYIIVCAPYIEEKFFRGLVNFSTYRELTTLGFNKTFSGVSGWIVSSVAFGFFHYVAYGGHVSMMITAFIFGMVACIGNAYLKSGAFGWSAHVFNNLMRFI